MGAGATPPGNKRNNAQQPSGIAVSIERPATLATNMRLSGMCWAWTLAQPIACGACDSPNPPAAAARSWTGSAQRYSSAGGTLSTISSLAVRLSRGSMSGSKGTLHRAIAAQHDQAVSASPAEADAGTIAA